MENNELKIGGAPPFEASYAEAIESYVCPHCSHSFGSASGHPGALLTLARCPECDNPFLVPGRLGDFALLERIALDGRGNVYRAAGQNLPHDVAVKVLSSSAGAGSELRERLSQNVRTATQLDNPHVAKIHALGMVSDLPFVVMELAAGESLASRLRGAQPMPELEALHVALDVTDGLAAMHDAGLIHGNVQPDSIRMGADGAARLTNPGLLGAQHKDAMGGFLGAPMYIAPELIKGGADTPHSDIYSLGVTLYCLLAGRPPFSGTTTDEIFKGHLFAVVFPIGVYAPALSVPTRAIISRMMRRDPAERFASCRELTAALQGALRALEAAPPAPVEEAPRPAAPPTPHRHLFKLLVTLCIAGGIGLFSLLLTYGPFGQPDLSRVVILPERILHKTVPPTTLRRPFGPAAVAAVNTCTRQSRPEWSHATLGAAVAHGMTLWRGDSVTIIGDGTGIGGTSDNFRFVNTSVRTPYVFSLRVTRIATTHPRAKTGIMVRSSNTAAASCVFVGFTGNGNLLFQCRRRDGDELETIRTSVVPLEGWSPCHLKLENLGDRFRAMVSRDGATWEFFGTCQAAMPARSQVGMAIASYAPGVLATSEHAAIRLLVPPPATTPRASP
jgi:serine/threonine protein kinase